MCTVGGRIQGKGRGNLTSIIFRRGAHALQNFGKLCNMHTRRDGIRSILHFVTLFCQGRCLFILNLVVCK